MLSLCSCAVFERMTSKRASKKFIQSCRVVSAPLDGRSGSIMLKSFLERTYGKHTGFKPTSLKTGKYAKVPAAVEVSRVLRQGQTAAGAAAAAGSDAREKPHSMMAWRAGSAYPPGSPRPSRSGSPHHRIYTGWGVLLPGKAQSSALEAAASAAAGPAPVYIWPTQVPAVLTQERMYDRNKSQPASRTPAWVSRRSTLLHDIAIGTDNMSDTHVRLQELYPELAASTDSSSSSSSSYTNKWAAAEQLQVYDMTWLERRAGAEDYSGAAPAGLSAPEPAVVPDATKPFTITLNNPTDGQDYIVAHYEPHALAARSSRNAALLCAMFHSSSKKMTRQSAGEKDEGMVMAGMRIPRSGANHYARYAGDEGE